MHEVERAIIVAAGTGQRMRPVTLQTPKPLVRVNGKRMIDTIIQGLHAQDVREIYVVVGYLKEQFRSLETEYPGLTIIENPFYDTCNNISSLYVAREHLPGAIVIDGDQIIVKSDILTRHFERSGYNCVWTDEPTDEWLLTVTDGVVTHCSRTGGRQGWQLYGVSRWSREDGARLAQHIQQEFDVKKNRQIYWDDVAMFCYPDQYTLGVHPMKPGDIVEIDSLAELASMDNSYLKYVKEAE